MASVGSIFLLYVCLVLPTKAQDIECSTTAMCNQIILNHSVQIKTHCVYLNVLFRNMSEDTLPVGIFRLCRSTLILDMSHNKLKYISAGAFLGLDNLKELYLDNNLIEIIEAGTFHTLTHMEVFVLAGNKLRNLPEYEFTSRSLLYFNINNNDLRKLSDTALLNLRNIELIDMSQNNLEEISPTALCNVRPGSKIMLNNNQLRSLAMLFNVTSKSQKYSVLQASGNVIKELGKHSLGDFYKLRLVTLDLGFNFITNIDVETFDKYITLKALHLNHNRIKSIHTELFQKLINLNMLDLSYNQLTSQVFFLKLPNAITSLNYSNNIIDEYVNYHTSAKLQRRYIRLDISNNSINFIDPNRFCKFINSVKLAYNNWTCNVLYSIVRNLEMRRVHIESGYDYGSDNIDGIPCNMGMSKLLDSKLEEVKHLLNKPMMSSTLSTSTVDFEYKKQFANHTYKLEETVVDDPGNTGTFQSSVASHLHINNYYAYILSLVSAINVLNR